MTLNHFEVVSCRVLGYMTETCVFGIYLVKLSVQELLPDRRRIANPCTGVSRARAPETPHGTLLWTPGHPIFPGHMSIQNEKPASYSNQSNPWQSHPSRFSVVSVFSGADLHVRHFRFFGLNMRNWDDWLRQGWLWVQPITGPFFEHSLSLDSVSFATPESFCFFISLSVCFPIELGLLSLSLSLSLSSRGCFLFFCFSLLLTENPPNINNVGLLSLDWPEVKKLLIPEAR